MSTKEILLHLNKHTHNLQSAHRPTAMASSQYH